MNQSESVPARNTGAKENDLTPEERLLQAIRISKTYVKAYQDLEFLSREELRPIRLQLELLKSEMTLSENRIHSTIVIFGSARIEPPEKAAAEIKALESKLDAHPKDKVLKLKLDVAKRLAARSRYYTEARKFAAIATRAGQSDGDRAIARGSAASESPRGAADREFVVMTGGGPGIMEAANRGALDAGGKSVGLTITLPKEQEPNPYITPELCFKFHYFAVRKMHFLMRCKALVSFPGGFGTMDELFETLTLIQTGKMQPIPILLFGKEFWTQAVNFHYMAKNGLITPQDMKLFHYVDRAEEAWTYIREYWRQNGYG